MRAVRTVLIFAIAIFSISVSYAGAQNYAPAASKPTRSMDEQVYRKLRGLMRSNVFDNITWQVNGSTITLSGKVITLGTRNEAARAVRDIPGVTSVVNNIEELPPSPMDDRIRRDAYVTFLSRGPAQYFGDPNPDVRIIVEHGHITLEGYVNNRSDSNTLNILANGISGVFSVTNNLIVGERRF